MSDLIEILPVVKSVCPELRLGILDACIEVNASNKEQIDEMNRVCIDIEGRMKVEEISKLPVIAASRSGYKALGKDPARYRLSAEALLRRVIKGKGLYQVNNVVDIINLVSIETGFSIGGYDRARISGRMQLSKGAPEEPYEAIGRGDLNIENLPVFRDEIGPFGSPTSDSVRTSIRPETQEIRLAIFDFDGKGELEDAFHRFESLLTRFAKGSLFSKNICE